MDLKKEVERLQEELNKFKNSPYCDVYLGILNQINTCNQDMIEKPAGLRDEEDAKAFERYEKFILKSDEYYQKLQHFRELMSPEEQVKVDEKAKKSKTLPI